MDFPADRLQHAGATPKEIARLAEGQQGWIAHFELIAEGDIRDWLASLRQSGFFKALKATTEKVVEEVETDLEKLTKAELTHRAEVAGIDVPDGFIKAEIVGLLNSDTEDSATQDAPKGEISETTGQEGEGQASQQDSTDAPDAPGADETPAAP